MKEEEQRAKFRGIGCVAGPLNPGTVQCDFYAEFMRRRFGPEIHESYAKEWADRFATNRQFHVADGESQKILLDIMLEGPGDGTAPFISRKVAKKWCENV